MNKMTDFFETRVENLEPKQDKKKAKEGEERQQKEEK